MPQVCSAVKSANGGYLHEEKVQDIDFGSEIDPMLSFQNTIMHLIGYISIKT